MNLSAENQHQLHSGLEQLQLHLAASAFDQVLVYTEALLKWNQSFNLIGASTEAELIAKHLLDCFSVAQYIQGQRIIDIGTGAGLPGLLLAIYYPEKTFTLLDSNGKKTRFLNHVIGQLSLNNVTVENNRVEAYHPKHCYDVIVTRAFSSLEKMLSLSNHLLCQHGQFVAMKGKLPQSELESLSINCHVEPINVPGLAETRHIVIFNRD